MGAQHPWGPVELWDTFKGENFQGDLECAGEPGEVLSWGRCWRILMNHVGSHNMGICCFRLEFSFGEASGMLRASLRMLRAISMGLTSHLLTEPWKRLTLNLPLLPLRWRLFEKQNGSHVRHKWPEQKARQPQHLEQLHTVDPPSGQLLVVGLHVVDAGEGKDCQDFSIERGTVVNVPCKVFAHQSLMHTHNQFLELQRPEQSGITSDCVVVFHILEKSWQTTCRSCQSQEHTDSALGCCVTTGFLQ